MMIRSWIEQELYEIDRNKKCFVGSMVTAVTVKKKGHMSFYQEEISIGSSETVKMIISYD